MNFKEETKQNYCPYAATHQRIQNMDDPLHFFYMTRCIGTSLTGNAISSCTKYDRKDICWAIFDSLNAFQKTKPIDDSKEIACPLCICTKPYEGVKAIDNPYGTFSIVVNILCCSDNMDSFSLKIKYCPLCGRKLECANPECEIQQITISKFVKEKQ